MNNSRTKRCIALLAGAFCIAVNNAGGSAGEGAVAGVNAGVVVERASPIAGEVNAGAFCEIGEDNTAEAPMEVTNPDGTVITGGSSAGASWDGAAAIAVEVVDHNNDGEANPRANSIYSETELQLLSSIAEEAANLFTTGKLGRLFNIETAATIIAGGGITAQ